MNAPVYPVSKIEQKSPNASAISEENKRLYGRGIGFYRRTEEVMPQASGDLGCQIRYLPLRRRARSFWTCSCRFHRMCQLLKWMRALDCVSPGSAKRWLTFTHLESRKSATDPVPVSPAFTNTRYKRLVVQMDKVAMPNREKRESVRH